MVPGVMAKLGEVMMKEGMRRNDYDIAWILPVSRMQEELGIEARWRGDGTAAFIYPTGDAIELVQEQGLAFTEGNTSGRSGSFCARATHKGDPEGFLRQTR